MATGSDLPTLTPTNFGFVNLHQAATPQTAPPPPSNQQWRRPNSMSTSRGIRPTAKKMRRHTLQPIHVSARHPVRDYGITPMTASIVGGYGHQEYDLAPHGSPPVPSFPGFEIPTSEVREYQAPTSAPYDTTFFDSSHLPWASQPLSPNFVSDHGSPPPPHLTTPAFFNGVDEVLSLHNTDPSRTASAMSTAPEDTTFTPPPDFHLLQDNGHLIFADDGNTRHPMTIPRMPSSQIGSTPELQFLIKYYDKVISPVIVAFDSPTNPYRAHILQLAIESQPLQHAIATLAACNLRIRRAQSSNPAILGTASDPLSTHALTVRQAHLAHDVMTTESQGFEQLGYGDDMACEMYHRSQAIQGLNRDLADHIRCQDESVIASLLILGLYHVCDTGIAKFKTQAAGMKKLLAIRNRKAAGRSHAVNWLTIMFTWFDSLSASVNDRAGELSTDSAQPWQTTESDWSLENLAGCDTELFKIISKLGHLNMLRQNRSSSTPPEGLASPPSTNDYYSMRNTTFEDNKPNYSELRSTARRSSSSSSSSSEFWHEWSAIKQSLQSWTFSPSSPSLSGHSSVDRQDILHISESFRFSALLYIERLAFQSLPSSHPSLQLLVSQALHHITRVKSDVFLLWPLFITGTETVAEGSRQLVREKVWQLQRDSGFFNNLSCLQLLERIWKEGSTEKNEGYNADVGRGERILAPAGMTGVTGLSPGEYSGDGFRWRTAMERVDGEYIVV